MIDGYQKGVDTVFRIDWKLGAVVIVVTLLLIWAGYTKLLIRQRDKARYEAATEPITATAEAEHRTAIERIKEIEKEYREINDTDGNATTGTANFDWMW